MRKTNFLFVYGILRKGMELDLSDKGCEFVGDARIISATLRPINTGVGLRFEYKDPLQVVYGEVFEIKPELWPWLDNIESNGIVYKRKIHPVELYFEDYSDDKIVTIDAWVYEHILWKYNSMYAEPIIDGKFRGWDDLGPT